jgi:hypothetical protein
MPVTSSSLLIVNEGREKYDSVRNNFHYKVVETANSVKLIETFLNSEKIIGQARNWKKKVFLQFALSQPETDERQKGYRLFLALKVLAEVKETKDVYTFLRVMNELTLEEVIFWVWQYHSYGKCAIAALKKIHFHSSGRRRKQGAWG